MDFNNIAKYINYFVGLILLILGLYCYISVESFTVTYDIELLTSQAKTEMRVISGFSLIIGYLILYFTFTIKEQKKIIFSTLMICCYFIIARISGLFIDGFNQTMTYYELILECIGFIFILYVYIKLK